MGLATYLSSLSPEYIDELLKEYLKNPNSVDDSWRYFFDGMEVGKDGSPFAKDSLAATQTISSTSSSANLDKLSSEAKVADLINAYRARGRLFAKLDPLGLSKPEDVNQLDHKNYGLKDHDLDRVFTAGKLAGLGPAPLKEIIQHLKNTYCRSIGVLFMNIEDREMREWLQDKMESCGNAELLTKESKIQILKRLTDAETFERFLHTRYVAQKRFSIEGGEALIPMLDRIVEVAADGGAKQVVMGMAHRGRLNVLTNTYGKLVEHILTEFEAEYKTEENASEGDVKYHMGCSADIVTKSGKPVHLSLANNPSHLEFVNPVVEGICKAKQIELQDHDRSAVMPILIHGDAAFAGQGVVYETLGFSGVEAYNTGGTIHIVVNNQIGFTANCKESRSTTQASDLGKLLAVPIFYVNGDDPEAVYLVARLATEFRQKFKKDVVIDLICYRKYGHNEGDEPSFTQPLMYKAIKAHPSTREIYSKTLVTQGVLTAEESQAQIDKVMKFLSEAQARVKAEKPRPFVSAFQNRWKAFRKGSEIDLHQQVETAVPESVLKSLVNQINSFPSQFHLHPKLTKFFEDRKSAVEKGQGIDWGNAETLAYASLLSEKFSVRITGQDAERGTFTHRHAVAHDFENGVSHCPLKGLAKEPDNYFFIHNSTLSETGVMGFEYGWSLVDPNALVIWEAQFGDFANGAQVIIDQFYSSGEAKWQRATGLVIYLPHGYEGQGPEHSSARLERFLQLCGKGNMIVANFSTPAQLFHGLRRQMKRDFRKPLVLMTPKSLLRHPKAVSTLDDFTKGSFHSVLDDTLLTDPKKVKRVLLCTGKVFYDLLAEREAKGRTDVAIIRMEQLYPWPTTELEAILQRYPAQKDYVWVQEEPRNQGAWQYIHSQWMGALKEDFKKRVKGADILYVGREAGAAPAVGNKKVHDKEQAEIIKTAFSV